MVFVCHFENYAAYVLAHCATFLNLQLIIVFFVQKVCIWLYLRYISLFKHSFQFALLEDHAII